MDNNRYCIIMAGGIGSRFWPISRRTMPKQFLDMLGTGKSFIRHTYERFAKIVPPENFLIVTNGSYKPLVLEHIPEIDEDQILSEPVGRNTAPCIAYAAWRLRVAAPDATMIVTPSDHLILDEDEFRRAIVESAEFAERQRALMTIGIRPDRPATGYGYIQVDNQVRLEQKDVYKVKTFTEKPNLELARSFVESGEFFWNSGIFIWKVDAIMENFELRHSAGTAKHRKDLSRVPEHLDRLRHYGESRRRLRTLQRFRLVGRRNVEFALPAFGQGRRRERRSGRKHALRHERLHRQGSGR